MVLTETQARLYRAMLKYFAIKDKTDQLSAQEARLRQARGDALYEINQVIQKNPDIFEGIQTERGEVGD